MSQIELIDPEQDPRWDKFVDEHPFGWVCHRSEWKRVIEKSFPHMKGYYWVKWDDRREKIIAGLPVYSVKSWLTGNRLISIPYATLSDPLVDNSSDLSELVEAAFVMIKQQKIKDFELRTHFSSNLLRSMEGLCNSNHYVLHELKIDKGLDGLIGSFHNNVRRLIKIAAKGDLLFKEGTKNSDLQEFYSHYILTRRSLGLPPQPYVFFKNIWKTLNKNGYMKLLLSYNKTKFASGFVVFKYKKRVSVDYAAWDRTLASLRPNHFLYWKAIEIAHNENCEIFDFGRTSATNKTLMQFKNQWRTLKKNLDHYNLSGLKTGINLRKENSLGYTLMNYLIACSPPKVCRLLGELTYRHIG